MVENADEKCTDERDAQVNRLVLDRIDRFKPMTIACSVSVYDTSVLIQAIQTTAQTKCNTSGSTIA